ncbi:putative uncharacterized protein [Clostridium sp. CAG:465]|nr:putative uncharacterized protein [Clostridium sp. CAG:465]
MKERKIKEKKVRKKINKKKLFINLAIYWAIGTIVTVVALYLVERYVISLSGADVNENKKENKEKGVKTINISKNAKDIQYSYDNKYYTYLFDSKVYIGSIESGEIIDTIEESNPICYFDLLYDKNLILYFTKTDNGTSATLKLTTYDIGTKRKIEYNTFTVKNFSRIKNMDMSPVINMIYINVEQKTGNSTNNIIYKINLFNTMSQIKSGLIVDRMIMLQQTDRVYYEDSNSNIYYSNSKLGIFKEKVNMIGIDTEDILYFISQDNSKVYKVKNNKITDTIELKDKDVKSTYYNNERVFVIYSDYVIEVSSDKPLESVGKIPNNVSFEAIKSDKMYVRVDDDTIKQIKLDLKDIEYDSQDIVDGQEKTTNNTTNNTKKTEQPKEEKKEEKKEETYKVPNVVGSAYSSQIDGFTLQKNIVDSEKPAGTIVSQSPAAGSHSTNKVIYVNVSSGS